MCGYRYTPEAASSHWCEQLPLELSVFLNCLAHLPLNHFQLLGCDNQTCACLISSISSTLIYNRHNCLRVFIGVFICWALAWICYRCMLPLWISWHNYISLWAWRKSQHDLIANSPKWLSLIYLFPVCVCMFETDFFSNCFSSLLLLCHYAVNLVWEC